MRTQAQAPAPVRDHVFLHDKLSGRYVDAGEATTVDRVLSFFSVGAVRIAPARIDATADGFTASDPAKASRQVLGDA